MYQPFNATAISHYYAGGNEHDVPAILYSDKGELAIRVKTDHDYIYITKQQAMEFFGLVDPAQYPGITDAEMQTAVTPIIPPAAPAVIDWDVLFLDAPHTFDVLHELFEAPTKEDAIRQFREDRGEDPYIINVIQRDPALGIYNPTTSNKE